MAQAYSAGLAVKDVHKVVKRRILPLKGEVLVKKGDMVKAEDIVAKTYLPGPVVPLNIANKLSCTAQLVHQYLKVKEGDSIKKGQIIAENNGFFGFFKTAVKSPVTGEIENVSKHTGQAILRRERIPIELKAFIDGKVVEVIPEEGVVIENNSTYIQGIFGLAGEVTGEIKVLADSPKDAITAKDIDASCKDKIIVTGSMATLEVIRKAKEMDVKAIVTGGINDEDLNTLLGYNIGVAITGHEEIGVTIVVTEGFGQINMAAKTYELLKNNEGKKASVHGKTQIRAGVMRPEIIIPSDKSINKDKDGEDGLPEINIGSYIRVIREPNFGITGRVTGIPETLHRVESETKVRILEAKLDNGEEVIIPRANIEVISE